MNSQNSDQIAYSVHPTVPYARKIIENMPAKTGHSIEAWAELVRASGEDTDKLRLSWLKSQHGLGGTTAKLVVDRAADRGLDGTDEAAYLAAAPAYVDAMYSGPKLQLRPIYDALIARALAWQKQLRISPCKTIVPLYRKHVFAEIKPTTNKRVDLGLALRQCNLPLPPRIIATRGLAAGDRLTHRIALTAASEVDNEVDDWLRTAYYLDA